MAINNSKVLFILHHLPSMDGLGFIKSYRSVVRNARISGLWMPLGGTEPGWKSCILTSYPLLMPVFLLWKVSCAALSIFSNDFEDMMLAQNVSGHMSTGMLLCLFYLCWRRELVSLIRGLDDLSRRLVSSSLGAEETFVGLYRRDSRRLCAMNNLLCTISAMMPFIYCTSAPVAAYLRGSYGQQLPMPVSCYFELHTPGTFEIFAFLQFVGNASAALHKLATEFTLFGMLKLLTAYFKYLSKSIQEIGKQISVRPNSEIMEKKLRWIEIHQGAIRNAQSLQELFSPVITLYFLSMVGIVACGVFFQINASQTNQAQGSSLGMYMVITIVQFYLLCYMADELCEEADKVATEVYCIPWFLLDPRARQSVRLLIHVGQKPIRIMAYQTPAFVLSKEAFVAFMTSLISAYMGFSKIKELS